MAIRLLAGTALLAGSLVPASAQLPDLRSLFTSPSPTTGTIPPAPAPTEWSGEPGASGHPLMTRDAIISAAANFRTCLEGLWPEAARRGISRASFDQHTAGLTPDLKIMDFLDSQPEFTKTFWEYLDLLVSEERILKGREVLAQHRDIFDAVEKAYGVDRHVDHGDLGRRVRNTAPWSASGR